MITPATIPMSAALDRDFDFEFEVTDNAGTPFDFTGYTAKMEVREAQSTAAPLVVEAVMTMEPGWLRGSISKGAVTFTEPLDCWFDVAMTFAGKTYNWVQGPFTFSGVATDA